MNFMNLLELLLASFFPAGQLLHGQQLREAEVGRMRRPSAMKLVPGPYLSEPLAPRRVFARQGLVPAPRLS